MCLPINDRNYYNYDFVEGNMVANVEAVKNGKKPIPHIPPKIQLVSRADSADRFLQKHILGCIFFQKYMG
jgi:hypothetical protein